MKLNEFLNEADYELSPQQRMLANIGRVLGVQAEQVKDDALANTMAKIGNELTNVGRSFAPTSLKDVADRTDLPVDVVKKIVMYGKKVADATAQIKKDHKDGGLNDHIEEKSKGLYYYVNKNKKSGKTPRKKGAKGAPTDQDWKDAAKTAKENVEETTSAGGVAAVAMPLGDMQSRTGPKKNKKPTKRSKDK